MASTVTGKAIQSAISKRLTSQGRESGGGASTQYETIMLDVMVAITANSATAIADAAAEVVQNPARPFVFGV
jgi:hypothetical protein